MESSLYVYNIQNLKKMQETMSKYHIVGIAYFMNIHSSVDDIIEMDSHEVNNIILDVTNLIQDYNISRIFSERYLWAIIDKFEDVHFSIQSNYFKYIKEMYPYFFSEDEINYDFASHAIDDSEGIKNEETELVSPLTLYTYRNLETIRDLNEKGLAISLAYLLQEGEGIVFKYDIENINKTIKEEMISYIDLSSIVKSLKIRNDLILQFEILIYKIVSLNDVKYSIEDSLRKEALKLFPLVFINEEKIDEDIDESMDEKDVEQISQDTDINQINLFVNEINKELRGHKVFKQDFRHNLLKFSFLNSMNDRKILSILLSGESGIGKTEFAKIVSNVMYPNETLTKINFGNYSTEGVLNSLIGSPLGYVGSDEGGELINKIVSSKSKIILIDEFERATSSVYNFFYELLEDGKFTDRHGVEHDLNGYIIVFTSNMTESQYQSHIPDSLKSRFDMVYNFEELKMDAKEEFINETAERLISKLNEEFGYRVDVNMIAEELIELQNHKNLRNIKREVEDVVFKDFFKNIEMDLPTSH